MMSQEALGRGHISFPDHLRCSDQCPGQGGAEGSWGWQPFAQLWARSRPSAVRPAEGSSPSAACGSCLSTGGSRRAGLAWEGAFKATAASWARQPLCGASLGLGNRGQGGSDLLGQKGSLEGCSQVRGSLEERKQGWFLVHCVSLGPAGNRGAYVTMRGFIPVCHAPERARPRGGAVGAAWPRLGARRPWAQVPGFRSLAA